MLFYKYICNVKKKNIIQFYEQPEYLRFVGLKRVRKEKQSYLQIGEFPPQRLQNADCVEHT